MGRARRRGASGCGPDKMPDVGPGDGDGDGGLYRDFRKHILSFVFSVHAMQEAVWSQVSQHRVTLLVPSWYLR